MNNPIKPDETHDFIGLFCPEPVFRTRQALDQMNVDGILEVIADDPAAEEDIPRMIKNLNQSLLRVTKDNNEFHFYIKKIK
jgi:tRNA 2-thiouridine synthesizing protein A